jgi:hypothetical protein
MLSIHCHKCGGFMSYRKRISYRLPSATTPRVSANTGVCSCSVPILEGPPPGFASLPAMPTAGALPTSGDSWRPQFRKNFKL